MLTQEEREQFIHEGFVVIHDAFPREGALDWVRAECALVGYDLDDPATWEQEYLRVNSQKPAMLASFSPPAWQASCDLVGGEDRLVKEPKIGMLAMNFKQGADKPYRPPSASVPGWHKDGWMFRHFLDSPEQALLGIPLLTDVLPEGGGTFIAADSVPVVARYFAAHPEGVLPDEIDYPALIAECRDFREVTGQGGDFFLLHPFMLHAISQNRLRRPRAINNTLFALRDPMNLNRANPAEYSPVEQAILHGLGVDHYDFQPTEPRFCTPDGGPINRAHLK